MRVMKEGSVAVYRGDEERKLFYGSDKGKDRAYRIDECGISMNYFASLCFIDLVYLPYLLATKKKKPTPSKISSNTVLLKTPGEGTSSDC